MKAIRSALAPVAGLWRRSPTFRMAGRQGGVAIAGYIVEALRAGDPLSLSALVVAGAVAGLTTLIGTTTPLEPFVGVNKAKVEVPMPPAEPSAP